MHLNTIAFNNEWNFIIHSFVHLNTIDTSVHSLSSKPNIDRAYISSFKILLDYWYMLFFVEGSCLLFSSSSIIFFNKIIIIIFLKFFYNGIYNSIGLSSIIRII